MAILGSVSYTPLDVYKRQRKAMIVWMPEKMNAECANKLLKLIEEPPEQTNFLLVSDEPEKILPTILSRTQQIEVKGIDHESLVEALRKTHPTEDVEALARLSLIHISNRTNDNAYRVPLRTTERSTDNHHGQSCTRRFRFQMCIRDRVYPRKLFLLPGNQFLANATRFRLVLESIQQLADEPYHLRPAIRQTHLSLIHHTDVQQLAQQSQNPVGITVHDPY